MHTKNFKVIIKSCPDRAPNTAQTVILTAPAGTRRLRNLKARGAQKVLDFSVQVTFYIAKTGIFIRASIFYIAYIAAFNFFICDRFLMAVIDIFILFSDD